VGEVQDQALAGLGLPEVIVETLLRIPSIPPKLNFNIWRIPFRKGMSIPNWMLIPGVFCRIASLLTSSVKITVEVLVWLRSWASWLKS